MTTSEPAIELCYLEADFPEHVVGLQKRVLRNHHVTFGETRDGKRPFLCCECADVASLEGWLFDVETLIRLAKPTWRHHVWLSLYPKKDRSHWMLPNALLHFLARKHLSLTVSFTGWGDERCGQREGRMLQEVRYRATPRAKSVCGLREPTLEWIEHITLRTSADSDGYTLSPRKLRRFSRENAAVIVSIRRYS